MTLLYGNLPHESAVATWRRLRHLVRVAPALLLTACLVPLLVVVDGSMAPVSFAAVRALLEAAPDLGVDHDPPASERPAPVAGIRPVWRPESRPQPLMAQVEGELPPADALSHSISFVLPPPGALSAPMRAAAGPLERRDSFVPDAYLRSLPIRGPPAAA